MKDEKRQPGILFDSIILAESQFKRERNIPEDIRIELSANVNNTFNEDKSKCNTELNFYLKAYTSENKECITFYVKYVAVFLVDESNNNMDIKEFAEKNAPAHMFAFVREHIANTTVKAGIRPIVLPPINIIALVNKKNNS